MSKITINENERKKIWKEINYICENLCSSVVNKMKTIYRLKVKSYSSKNFKIVSISFKNSGSSLIWFSTLFIEWRTVE